MTISREPKWAATSLTTLMMSSGLATSSVHAFADAAGCGDLAGDGLRGLGVDIGDGDVGALGGEHQRRGAAHAAGGAGDENGQAFDRAAELLEI